MFSNKISRIIKFFFYISFCSLFGFFVYNLISHHSQFYRKYLFLKIFLQNFWIKKENFVSLHQNFHRYGN